MLQILYLIFHHLFCLFLHVWLKLSLIFSFVIQSVFYCCCFFVLYSSFININVFNTYINTSINRRMWVLYLMWVPFCVVGICRQKNKVKNEKYSTQRARFIKWNILNDVVTLLLLWLTDLNPTTVCSFIRTIHWIPFFRISAFENAFYVNFSVPWTKKPVKSVQVTIQRTSQCKAHMKSPQQRFIFICNFIWWIS